MKTFKLPLIAFAASLPLHVFGHPGHDGHELTWDFHVHGWEHVAWIAVGVIILGSLYRYARNRS